MTDLTARTPKKGWLAIDAEAITVLAVLGSTAIVALGNSLGLIGSGHPAVQMLVRAGGSVREVLYWVFLHS